MNMTGKRVLLTGANGGIGRAIAHELTRQGAELILSGRNREPLEALAAELGGAECIVADMACDLDLQQLVSEAGRVDILVANAGLPGTDDITAFSVAQIDACLAVNLRAPIVLARALMPEMLARGSGHLVFISSVAGKVPSPLSSLYSAGKYGLRGFADCLRMDLQGTCVGVSTIYPGMIRDAGMYANSGASVPPGAPTNTAQDVAVAVSDAIRRNQAAVNVTGLAIRLGIHLAHFSPALNGWIQRLAGAGRAAREFADGHRARNQSR